MSRTHHFLKDKETKLFERLKERELEFLIPAKVGGGVSIIGFSVYETVIVDTLARSTMWKYSKKNVFTLVALAPDNVGQCDKCFFL